MPRHHSIRNRRSARIADRTYCRHTDDGGYCCTSAAHPGAVWCETHNVMYQRGIDSSILGYEPGAPSLSAVDPYSTARGSLPAVWTNTLTAEASQAALQNAGVSPQAAAGALTAAIAQPAQRHVNLPVGKTAPAGVSPAQPASALGDGHQGVRALPIPGGPLRHRGLGGRGGSPARRQEHGQPAQTGRVHRAQDRHRRGRRARHDIQRQGHQAGRQRGRGLCGRRGRGRRQGAPVEVAPVLAGAGHARRRIEPRTRG